MKPLTRQELFDNAARGVIKQGGASLSQRDGVVRCAYQTARNSRCAIGHSIPDGHEGLFFSGAVGKLCAEYPDLNELFDLSSNHLLLSDLQKAHDGSWFAAGDEFLERFIRAMKIVAQNHNLDASSLKEVG